MEQANEDRNARHRQPRSPGRLLPSGRVDAGQGRPDPSGSRDCPPEPERDPRASLAEGRTGEPPELSRYESGPAETITFPPALEPTFWRKVDPMNTVAARRPRVKPARSIRLILAPTAL